MTREEYLKFVRKTLDDIYNVIEAKNNDYCGNSNDPFFNVSLTEKMGAVETEKGIFCRITDKYSRLASFFNTKHKVKNETVDDTLKDLAGYCLLWLGVMESKKNENKD